MTQTSPKKTLTETKNKDNYLDSTLKLSRKNQNNGRPNLSAPDSQREKVSKGQISRGVTLSRQLLQTILPSVFIPLIIASGLAYINEQKKASDTIKNNLKNQALLVGEITSQTLENAKKIPTVMANNPIVIRAASEGSQLAETNKLAQMPIEEVEKKFAATKLLVPNQELNNYLKKIVETEGLAEVFFTERNGLNIAYSNATSDFVQRDEQWWQKGKSQGLWIGDIKLDQSSNSWSVEIIKAIREPKSGTFLGVIKAVLPAKSFDAIIPTYLEHTNLGKSENIQLIDTTQSKLLINITLEGSNPLEEVTGTETILKVTTTLNKAVKNANTDLKELSNDWAKEYGFSQVDIKTHTHETGEKALVAAFTYQDRQYSLATVPNTNVVAITSITTKEIKLTARDLINFFLLTELLVLVVIGGVILLISRQVSQPIQNLSNVAQEVAEGNLDVVAQTTGTTETQTLAETFNNLVIQIKELLNQQELAIQKTRLLAEVTRARVIDDPSLQVIFNEALKQARDLLGVDRLVIYRFNQDWSGYISHESVAAGFKQALNQQIEDACIPKALLNAYKNDRVVPTEDVFAAGFHPDHQKLMEQLDIKANLVVPILNQGELHGLLIAHNCQTTHIWQEDEINFLRQLAGTLGVTLERVNFIQQQAQAEEGQRQEKEKLQRRAMELLIEVDPVSKGDLTVRAKITPDEIGTVADSYNSTVENLRKIVARVQTASKQVVSTTSQNEELVQKLSSEATRQLTEIQQALSRIQSMAESIAAVADNATKASDTVQTASQTLEVGDATMNRTVDGILAVRETVVETAEKVKKLGESSQKISQIVNLIGRFAAQTHLLALKASIEAARAGEEGQGFAVIADEVRSLATQSAEATEKIEILVSEIQSETSQVVRAMEIGKSQVEMGTALVNETRATLTEIQTASTQINQLVKAIASLTVEQTTDSEQVSQTMTDVAAIAATTSKAAADVSASFKELLTLAEQLQESVEKFKVS